MDPSPSLLAPLGYGPPKPVLPRGLTSGFRGAASRGACRVAAPQGRRSSLSAGAAANVAPSTGGRGGRKGGRGTRNLPELFEAMQEGRGNRGRQGRGQGGGRSGRGRGTGGRNQQQQQQGDDSSASIPLLRIADDRKAAATDFFSDESWKTSGARPDVVDAVKSLGFHRPSHVQADSYKQLSTGTDHVVIADRAGSGKTLAYLLPIVQALREEEKAARAEGRTISEPKRPRLVIVAPTEELVVQVRRVLQALGGAGLPLRSTVMTGGHKYKSQKEALAGGVDVVIATPGRLVQHIQDGNLDLSKCRAVVLDEVDVLLAPVSDFRDEVIELRSKAPKDLRFVMATATLPHAVYLNLLEEFPYLEVFQGPGLHRNPPGVTEQLVDCSGGDEVNADTGFKRKADALLALLEKNPVDRCIVFCNKIDTCRTIENLLNRQPGDDKPSVLPCHAAISDANRQRYLEEFLSAPDGHRRKILVCTDRASRGLDSAFVDHVVLFDFPRDPSEYVRRVGRTARGAGGQGLVTSLVLGRQVGLAQNIINRNQRGIPIHKVPAS